MKRKMILVLAQVVLLCMLAVSASAAQFNDDSALAGHKTGRLLFDINLTSAQKMVLYLNVIDKTYEDIKANGMKPEIVLAFRGLAVTFLKTDYLGLSADEAGVLKKVRGQLEALMTKGVKMEACSIALGLFSKNYDVIPGIKVVNNTFMSLLGYHNQGYASIPVM